MATSSHRVGTSWAREPGFCLDAPTSLLRALPQFETSRSARPYKTPRNGVPALRTTAYHWHFPTRQNLRSIPMCDAVDGQREGARSLAGR